MTLAVLQNTADSLHDNNYGITTEQSEHTALNSVNVTSAVQRNNRHVRSVPKVMRMI